MHKHAPHAAGGALIAGGAALAATAMIVPVGARSVTGDRDSEGVRGLSDEESPV